MSRKNKENFMAISLVFLITIAIFSIYRLREDELKMVSGSIFLLINRE